MPRFKPVHQGLKLLPVDFDRQIQPGSFEHALCYLVDKELDLAPFHARYKNDDEGAPAYDPAVLLKIILLAYSRGIVSSRRIEAACRENVLFIAVSGDSQPNFTTLAAFVSEMGELTAKLFAQVLTICDRQGLIGREMFAIDGVKLPAHASKAKSGTRDDFKRQLDKMEKAAEKILTKHREADTAPAAPKDKQRESRTLERLQRDAKQLRDWLAKHPEDRKGASGKTVLSNLTDNESAKMATGKGVIQGYPGVSVVDEQNQIVVEAQAHGTGSEQALLMPAVEAVEGLRTPETVITADAGYHSEANLERLAEAEIPAYLPDNDYRQRDARYAGQEAHRAKPDPLYDKRPQQKKAGGQFQVSDFRIDPEQRTCLCPAGKALYSNGKNCNIGGRLAIKFQGAKRDCEPCTLRGQCLRKPDTTPVRQVAWFFAKAEGAPNHCEQMKHRIDSEEGKRMITRRFATVEPVFGNLRGNKRLDRFTLRGQKKVDGQWKLYCMVHNIEKLAHHGLGM
ncbi:MAG: IS1182 family transposase [Pseudomonadota bacterium]